MFKNICLFVTTVALSCSAMAGAHKGRNPSSNVDCMKKNQAAACATELLRTMKKDAFLNSLLVAEAKRLPSSWKCETPSDWTVDAGTEGPTAKTLITCSGPEQHVNVEFSGNVQTNEAGNWVVYITSFNETAGD